MFSLHSEISNLDLCRICRSLASSNTAPRWWWKVSKCLRVKKKNKLWNLISSVYPFSMPSRKWYFATPTRARSNPTLNFGAGNVCNTHDQNSSVECDAQRSSEPNRWLITITSLRYIKKKKHHISNTNACTMETFKFLLTSCFALMRKLTGAHQQCVYSSSPNSLARSALKKKIDFLLLAAVVALHCASSRWSLIFWHESCPLVAIIC